MFRLASINGPVIVVNYQRPALAFRCFSEDEHPYLASAGLPTLDQWRQIGHLDTALLHAGLSRRGLHRRQFHPAGSSAPPLCCRVMTYCLPTLDQRRQIGHRCRT